MNYRLIAGFLVVLLALLVQFSFGAAGVTVDLVLAALVVLAFFFEWPQLAVFVLFAAFILNAEPWVSPAILLFSAIPFAAYAFRLFFTLTPWAGIPVAIFLGSVLFYSIMAPYMFMSALPLIALDIGGSLVFGELAFAMLRAAER